MRAIKGFPITILLLLVGLFAKGQYVSYGTDPWGQQWRQIKTPHFQVIYPKALDSMAQRYTWLLDSSYTLGSRSIGHKPVRIPVILHPDNVNSNGVVVWAPRRMELMVTPPVDIYSMPWDKQLAIHEFRHVAQIDKLNRGGMKLAYYLFGEQASALWLFPVPKWFLEGDAVAMETALSSSGRGRLPEFHMPYRAYLLSGIDWRYDKWLNGSYKDYVPNEYPFGYEQVAYARYHWGGDVWDKILDQTIRGYLHIPTFSNAVKKYTGISSKELQRQTFDYLAQEWKQQNDDNPKDPNISYLTDEQRSHTSYRYPIVVEGLGVVALKTAMSRTPAIVLIKNDGSEKRLLSCGSINGKLTLNNGKLYWSENVADARWEQRSHADIKSLNIQTGKVDRLTHRTRYFNPTFISEGREYAVSEADREGNNSIVLLNAETNEPQVRYATPLNSFVKELTWLESENLLAALLLNDDGLGIYTLNSETGKWSAVSQESSVNISGLSCYENLIIFESGFNGVNNIYALDMRSKEIFRLTSSRFGAFDPFVKSNTLYFSDYQTYGYRLAQKPLNPNVWQKVDWGNPYRFKLADMLSEQEGVSMDTVVVPSEKTYESKPYRKLPHLFRLHSWMPFYVGLQSDMTFDYDDLFQSISPGVTLLSQNSLSTAVTCLGYSYENGYSAVHGSFSYSGWYPVVDITADYGGGKRLLIKNNTLYEGTENRYNASIRTYIPLVFNSTRYLRGITPKAELELSNNGYFVPSENNYKNAVSLDLSLQFYLLNRMAVQNIYPRWGGILTLGYDNMPFDTENFGSVMAGKLSVYTPGLFANHGLKLSAGLQKQQVERYYLSSILDFPRGYNEYPSEALQVYSADYAFPVLYPDFNIWRLLYFKRFRLNLFADYGENRYLTNTGKRTDDMFSYGLDILADYHIIQQASPVVTGIRLTKPRDFYWTFEVLFGIAF